MEEWYPKSPAGRGRRPGGKSKIARWTTRLLIVGVFLACVVGGAYLVNRGVDWFQVKSTTSTTVASHGAAVKLTVSPGMTALEVGELLQQKGVIESSAEFVDMVKTRGTENTLRPGIYEFYKDQQLLEVVDMLEQGKGQPTFKLTIKEGLAVSQIGALLTQGGDISGPRYVELSGTPDEFIVPRVGGTVPKVTTLEGLLFPSTYYLIEGEGATELIGAQLAAFESKTASLAWANCQTLGITPYQAVIVASLIEKEVSVPDERPLVAAVIYNRLKKSMSLGIDATVRYALDKWKGTLTDADLNTQSPYNTRMVKGLPPGPIASPGLEALKAALAPAKVDYLYYVLSDNEGHHFFTASYDEFLKAKEKQPTQ